MCAANPGECEQLASELGERLPIQNAGQALSQAAPAVEQFAEEICQPGVLQEVQDLGQAAASKRAPSSSGVPRYAPKCGYIDDPL